jgi:hypothetical protein
MNAHSWQQQFVRQISETCRWFVWCALGLMGCQAIAEKIYYSLDNVLFLKEGTTTDLQQMHGYFTWTYTQGDFENGTGVFLYLDIPETTHDHTDLTATVDTNSIEFTLTANTDSDGVDISLKLLNSLTPDGPATIDTGSSSFDIGGDGFYKGTLSSGHVTPFEFELSIQSTTPTTASVSWTPDYPGAGVLQESPTLAPTAWANAASGNPRSVNTTAPQMFYQLVLP